MELIEKFIIEKVKRKRLEMNFTVQEVSTIIEVSQNFINNIESAYSHHKYNIVHLSKLSFLFECSVKDFFPEKEDYFSIEDQQILKEIKEQIIRQKKNRIQKRR